MAQDIILEVHCFGCRKEVSPAEVDWFLFRQTGIPIHNRARCRRLANSRIYPDLSNRKEVVPSGQKKKNPVKTTP